MGSYAWSQDDEEITVEVLVPKVPHMALRRGVLDARRMCQGTTSKNITVVFKPTHLRIEVRTLEEGKQLVLDAVLGGKADGEVCQSCMLPLRLGLTDTVLHSQESSWGLCDAAAGRQLTVTVTKHYSMQGNWAQFIVPV
jgi:hypothetical protein